VERYAVKKLAPLWVQLTVIWPLPATTVVRTGASITGATVVVVVVVGDAVVVVGAALVVVGAAVVVVVVVGAPVVVVEITPVTDSTVGLIYAAIVAAPWTSGCF